MRVTARTSSSSVCPRPRQGINHIWHRPQACVFATAAWRGTFDFAAHPGQPCRCPANPITRCRRHSLATEILRAGASLATVQDALLDREGCGKDSGGGNHRRPAHPVLSADRAADSRMTTRPALRGQPPRDRSRWLGCWMQETGVPGGYRAALNAGARSGSGVSGRGGPGTFASTCCAHGRI
jgi:hypothetical protein